METSTPGSDAIWWHRLSGFGVAALLIAATLLMAIGVIVVVDRAENYGLSDRQLRQIEAHCQQRATERVRERGADFDEALERCQRAEKVYRSGGDPFPPI